MCTFKPNEQARTTSTTHIRELKLKIILLHVVFVLLSGFKVMVLAHITHAVDSYTDVDSADRATSAVGNIQSMLGAKVAPRWYQMGVTLGTRVADLEAIRAKKDLSAQESERRMLDAWLKNTENTKTTWQWLVDAVGHRAGGNHPRLAKTLAEKIATKLTGEGI